MAGECAIEFEANKGRFPRILRWKATEFFQFDYLARFFQPGNIQLVPIVPTGAEIVSLTRLGIDMSSSQLPHNIVELEVQSKRKRDSGVEADAKGKKKIKTIKNLIGKGTRCSARINKAQFENGVDLEGNLGVGTSAANSMSRYSEDASNEDIATNVTLHELDALLKSILSRFYNVEDWMRENGSVIVQILAKVTHLEGCIGQNKCVEGVNESDNSTVKKNCDQVSVANDGDRGKCIVIPNTLSPTSPMKKNTPIVEASPPLELSDEEVEIVGTSMKSGREV